MQWTQKNEIQEKCDTKQKNSQKTFEEDGRKRFECYHTERRRQFLIKFNQVENGKNTWLVSHKIFIKLTFLPKVVRTYAYKTISKLAESVCTRELDGAWTIDKTHIFSLSNVWKYIAARRESGERKMEGRKFWIFSISSKPSNEHPLNLAHF